MMSYLLQDRVIPRIVEIEAAGGDCSDRRWILERLRHGREIPDRFNDHALAGKLRGLRSVIVGHDGKGRTVVMVYQLRSRRITVALVDEHDQAYRTLVRERSS